MESSLNLITTLSKHESSTCRQIKSNLKGDKFYFDNTIKMSHKSAATDTMFLVRTPHITLFFFFGDTFIIYQRGVSNGKLKCKLQDV